jgi:hypothetical protein
LADPLYARKANALYREFEEIGMNRLLHDHKPASAAYSQLLRLMTATGHWSGQTTTPALPVEHHDFVSSPKLRAF